MRQRQLWFDLHDDSAAAPTVAIVGLPYDASSSLKAGAALAPARLREISRTADAITRRGKVVSGVSVRDFGDVAPLDPSGREMSQREYLDSAATKLAGLPRECFVIALGGDNSVSIACLRSFAQRHGRAAGVIWLDAHPDLFESYDGNPDSHACALRRAMTLAGLSPSNAVLLGTRSFSHEESRFIHEQGIEVITAADWRSAQTEEVARRIAGRLKNLPAIYLAVDIDGFDSACAPGTGYPMPGGLGGEAFFALQERLFQRLPVRAMDITEISPPLDTNDVTSFLGVQIVLETLGSLTV